MKELLKKLNNFRLSSLISACAALFGCLVVAGALVAYQFSAAPTTGEAAGGRTYTTIAFFNNQSLGMVFFLFAIFAIIIGIVVIYKAFPYILPKQKLEPLKSMGWVLLAENVLILGLVVLMFIILITEKTIIPAVWCVLIALGTMSVGFSGMWVYPTLKCRYYTPEIAKK